MNLLLYILVSLQIVPTFYKNEQSFMKDIKVNPGFKLIKVYPNEDIEPPESTTIWIGYSQDALYVFARNYQKGIQASTRKRDSENIMADDWTLVYVDTQGRGNEAYCFQFNPLGTKRDFILTEGGSNVEEWDGDWHVDVKNTEYGWDALLVIHFKSISFAKTDWGIQIERYIAKNTELQLLVKLPSFQQVKGIAALKLDFNKISIESASYSLIPIVELRIEKEHSREGKDNFSFRYGATARFKEGSGTLLDLTHRPDFSDVEADIEQINLERLPVNYPEKRPFFMEGKDLISTPIELVRTRNIEYPVAGLKFYTRGKKLSFAGYFVKDSLLKYVGFSRATYSFEKNFILGIFNTSTQGNFNLYSMDMNLYIPQVKMDIIGLLGKRMDTKSNIIYVKLKRRQEFKGLGFSLSYLSIDSSFISPIHLIYFDRVRRYSATLNYQFLLSKININVYGDYSTRKDKYTNELISEEYGPGISVSLAPFSFSLGSSRALLNYTGLPDARMDINFISFAYSLSSWKNISLSLNSGKYFGSDLKYIALRLNLSPFNKFNIGFQEDFIDCDIMPEKSVFQIFGEIPLTYAITFKPYLNYKKYKEGYDEVALNGIVSYDLSSTTGIYLGFTKNLSKNGKEWESNYEKIVFKIKAGYDLMNLIH